jgi:hypothetical protein
MVEYALKTGLQRCILRVKVFQAHLPPIFVAITIREEKINLAGRSKRKGTYANCTLRSMGISSHPFASTLHRSVNVRHTRARTSAGQFHVQRLLVSRVHQNTRRSDDDDDVEDSALCSSTSAQSIAHCVRASCGVSVSHTSSASLSISHVSSDSLADPPSACVGSTARACVQSARTTASFIAAFERVCGARSTPEGTSCTLGSLRISCISETASLASFETESSSWSWSSSVERCRPCSAALRSPRQDWTSSG